MLARFSAANIRRWTFEAPKHAPTQQAFVYDFRMEGNAVCDLPPANVRLDLPDRITISVQPVENCDPVSITKTTRILK
jgi:hypothetical protein